ncbi:type II methionyl aminopeptidase, partial [archaeon]
TLPFAIRWIKASKAKLKILDKLARKKLVYCYPVLIEARRGFVSQCETTVVVKKNGCEVLSEIL